jgi:hypothetical protein
VRSKRASFCRVVLVNVNDTLALITRLQVGSCCVPSNAEKFMTKFSPMLWSNSSRELEFICQKEHYEDPAQNSLPSCHNVLTTKLLRRFNRIFSTKEKMRRLHDGIYVWENLLSASARKVCFGFCLWFLKFKTWDSSGRLGVINYLG